jgi:nicotinamide riboside transporter PnuC
MQATVPNEWWYKSLKVLAMLTGIAGSLAIAVSKVWVAYGFAFFLVSSLIWVYTSMRQKEYSLLILQISFVLRDTWGIIRWMT